MYESHSLKLNQPHRQAVDLAHVMFIHAELLPRIDYIIPYYSGNVNKKLALCLLFWTLMINGVAFSVDFLTCFVNMKKLEQPVSDRVRKGARQKYEQNRKQQIGQQF